MKIFVCLMIHSSSHPLTSPTPSVVISIITSLGSTSSSSDPDTAQLISDNTHLLEDGHQDVVRSSMHHSLLAPSSGKNITKVHKAPEYMIISTSVL